LIISEEFFVPLKSAVKKNGGTDRYNR